MLVARFLKINFLLKFNISNMSTFIQKLNPITCQNEWIIQNEDYDYHQEVARAAFADMLHDTERNEMYEKGIIAAIKFMHKNGKKANVLDIGTGTGLLSMMAARHGADTIVACEAFKPMGICAKEVIKLNGFEEKIKVIEKRSTELKVGENGDMLYKANILVTEVFDTELIGEGALGTFQHAHKELLEKDCIVVPHSGTIYAQVIESPLVKNWNRLKDVFDNEGKLLLKIPDSTKNCKGTISLHDVQLSQIPIEQFKTITEPQKVFRFDFSGKTPYIFKRSTINTIKSQQSGTAHAVFMWWDLIMDINNEIVLSCAPFWAHPLYNQTTIPWRDHWMQAIYYFPKEIEFKAGEELNLISCHDEYSLWFNLKKDLSICDKDYEGPVCDCFLHLSYGRTRIGQMNDGIRLKKYLRVIEEHVKKDDIVLILSNGFYLGLAAAKLAKTVYCLENNVLSRNFMKSVIEVNKFVNVELIEDLKEVKMDDKIDFVIGDPYFISSILPWDNLHYLHILRQSKGILSENVKIFPQKAKIMGLPMQFRDLHKIRAPLGSCQDFKMKPFDNLIETSSEISDENIEAQPLWEYPGIALTQPKEIAFIDINIQDKNTCDNTGTFNMKNVELCNGIAFWVDWILDNENPRKNTITTGPIRPFEIGENVPWDMHTRQGVCLLGGKQIGNALSYNFKYDYNNGHIYFKICQ